MVNQTLTSPSLLMRIRDCDDIAAWSQFVEIYTPLIFRHARRRGLQVADAADVTQDVLREVANSIGSFEYDPQLGRFRNWLHKVTQFRFAHWCKQRKRMAVGSGDSMVNAALEQLVDPNNPDERAWELEYQRHLFCWAADKIKHQFQDTTWQAFWRTSVDGCSPVNVAKELNVSVGAVYISRNRIIGRLKKMIQGIDETA